MSLLTSAVLGLAIIASSVAHATTVTVVNLDGAGEGFNDPTPLAPVGGNLGTTLGAQRLNAFQHAANTWARLLLSPAEIRIGARFDPLPCTATSAVLGAAGPIAVFRDFAGAIAANTWYPLALANALHGSHLAPSTDDISATFNSSLGTSCPFPRGWYYGLDGNPGSNIDFVSVVIHELAHGLGFITFVNLGTGAKLSGFDDTYMRNLERHGATPSNYPAMTNAQRIAASTDTGNLHWVGPQVRALSGVLTAGRVGDHVRMFAPNPAQAGSSVTHWDSLLAPNQLLEPVYTEPLHTPVLELGAFQDIGWIPNPITTFVTSFYTIVLGRAPEAAGFGGWFAFLGANCNPGGVSTLAHTFYDSVEFRTARPLTLVQLVTILYHNFLGRDPDSLGLAGWVEAFRQERLALALEGFIDSAEFQALLPNRHDPAAVTPVVTRLYTEVLGRAPDLAGRAGWVNYIVTSGDLEGAALGFLRSAEFEARAITFRSYITILYRAFLGRNPDASGLDGWEVRLRSHLLPVIDAAFIPSEVFQGRIPAVCGI